MKKPFKYSFFLLFLFSCSSDLDQSIEANLLIAPDYNFSNYLIECELKESANLLNLESFLSILIKDDFYNDNNFEIKAYFPKTDYVDKFIFNIQNSTEVNIYNSFINDLSQKGFDKIALCNFNTDKLKGISLFDSELTSNKSSITSEILSCNYNDGYNYGTFKLAIDRFLNHMSLLKIPYQISYLQADNNSSEFTWINNFYSENYTEEITELWINTKEAREIKDEFLQNAQCIESNLYNSFTIN